MFSTARIVLPQWGHLLRPFERGSRRGIRYAAAVAKLPKTSPRTAALTIRTTSSGPDDADAARFDDVKRLRVADVVPDAPEQGVGLERLHDDVVGSDLIVEHLVRIGLAGHDDDGDPRDRRMLLHLVVHAAPRYVGHHQVEEYQVRPAKLGLGKPLETVSSLHDVVALLLEDELLELADGFFVFDYEDRLGHGRKISVEQAWPREIRQTDAVCERLHLAVHQSH